MSIIAIIATKIVILEVALMFTTITTITLTMTRRAVERNTSTITLQ